MISGLKFGLSTLAVTMAACPVITHPQASDSLPTALATSDNWRQYRQQIMTEGAALSAQVKAHNAACTAVPPQDTARIAQCQQSKAALLAASAAYEARLASYRKAIADPFAAPVGTSVKAVRRNGRDYRVSGNGMIGGTIWITGYNVQSADPALVARAHAMMQDQMRLAGQAYADAVDFDHYNFVLGIAAANDSAGEIIGPLLDLGTRVLPDESTNGGFSADNQALYVSLKGRAFGDLACHSNGAMVCLAAIARGDIVADHVILFGPQITASALRIWDRLVRDGTVKSVQLVYNTGDPVAPVSLAIGGGVSPRGAAIAAFSLFQPAILTDVVHDLAPSISMRTLTCGEGLKLACHDMAVYRANLNAAGCKPHASGLKVPGTALPGRPDTALLEPPTPC